MFRSIEDVKSFDIFCQAIIDCSSEWHGHLNTPIPVVFQAQIDCDVSALVLIDGDNFLIEISPGNLGPSASGIRMPNVISGVFDAGSISFAGAVGDHAADDILEIAKLSRQLSTPGLPVLLEVGKQKTLYVFQYQQIEKHIGKELLEDRVILPSKLLAHYPNGQAAIGSKAAAMRYFRDAGLFPNELIVLQAGDELSGRESRSIRSWKGPITVRLSDRYQLGLRRVFARDGNQAAQEIIRRPTNTAAIAHRFIPVARSFELLLSTDSMLIEHVPGMWESQNELPPDAILLSKFDPPIAYRYLADRKIHSGRDTAGRFDIAGPLDASVFSRWLERIAPIAARLRRDLHVHTPVSIHFVEDEDGAWHFLNIRPGYEYHLPALSKVGVHVVRNLRDMELWNGKSPILLRVTTERGHEADLAPLAKILSTVDTSIFADFGILSHPAMVLMSHGVRLTPAYLSAFLQVDKEYETLRLQVDVGRDPVDRISREPKVFETDTTVVVYDREPIKGGHLLAVAQESVASFADLNDGPRVAAALIERLAEHSRGVGFVYERGRAAFCTSGFTNQHAHMHFVPIGNPASAALKLATELHAFRFGSALDAWASVEPNTEYLIFGQSNGPFFLAQPFHPQEKRFVRDFLGGHNEH